ncbi:MAG TPA: uroporphyrinogen decarboxylase family protein [Atribacterota bacterium]|nr:uroporphyrinogen decarboxylase family protein [Atribacterota bacterium]
MNSRERVQATINHIKPDKVPIDLGSTLVTGIQAGIYSRFKKALGLKKGKVKIYDPFQMLAEVEEEVRQRLGIDTYGIQLPQTIFGYKNENWKPFKLFDGTEVLVPDNFNVNALDNGDLLQFPNGDNNFPPSGKMPRGGHYFDILVRQEPIDENKLDPKEWVEQSFARYNEEDLRFLEEQSKWYYRNTEYALLGNFWGAGFGDIALVQGPNIAYPKGIRHPEEWLISMISRKNYIKDIFHYQYELQMENLKLYHEAVQNRIDVIVMSGTDFGAQNGPMISPEIYRELFKPFHEKMNNWIHSHTHWKTFYHTCGSILAFIDDFIEAGIDILNPVQLSAAHMNPEILKELYGKKIVFWGGGINTQNTLPFGTPQEVKEEVNHLIKIFSRDGGYVFAPVHNIQSDVPVENLMVMFDETTGKSS